MAVRFPEPIHPVDPVELEINQLFDHLIVCLNQRRVALLTTYRDTRAQIAAKPIARARKEEELIGLKTETEARLQMNELRELQERLLIEIEQKLAEVRVPQPETRPVFRGNCGHLEQVFAGVGEVVEEEVPIVPRYQEMRPIVTVAKEGKAPGELHNPNAVAIDRNSNHIYVAEGSLLGNFARISIFSDGGEFLNSYTHEHMKSPFGIAIHTNNMYVSDIEVQAVFQFKIESDIRLVAKLGTKGTGNGEFYYPSNLAVSTNGDVYVGDHDNNRIQILDSSLHYLRTLTEQPIPRPRDIKFTADSVYVLCGVSPCIRVFSYTGDMLRSLITRGDQLQVNNAWYFCLDSQENIIISDFVTSDIKAFSKEGTLIRTIGGRGQEVGMFLSPTGLTLNNELNLIVLSHNKNYRLQIFSSL